MEAPENSAKVENAKDFISALSAAKPEKKQGAGMKALEKHRALHLYIRTQSSGAQKYVVVRRPADSTKLVLVTLCDAAMGEKRAVKLAIAVNEKMDRGVNPNAEKKAKRQAERDEKLKAKHSLFTVGESYIARCKRHGRSEVTLAEYQRILDSDDLRTWHARPVSELSGENIESLVRKVRARAPKMANRVYGFLHGAFGHALKTRVLAVNPLAHFDREEHLTKERSRTRSLCHAYTGDLSELKAVWDGVDEIDPPHHPARALVKILILTGLRVGTLAKVHNEDALLWRHVKDLDDPKRARLEIPWQLRKTGEDGDDVFLVPLVPAAAEIFRGLAKAGEDAPVFSIDGREPMRIYPKLRDKYRALASKAAGRKLEPWTLHDLRRSVGTGLGFLGCPHAVIDEVLDHVSESKAGIRGVYDLSIRVDVRREWLQKWAHRLTGKEG